MTSLIGYTPYGIGKDPGCPPDILNNFSLDNITEKIYETINGKKSFSILNVGFICNQFNFLALLYIMGTTFTFPKEIKVIKIINLIN